MYGKKKNQGTGGKAPAPAVAEGGVFLRELSTFRELRKEVQSFVDQHTLWKDKNQMEKQRVLELGGRKPKGEKRTLAVHLQMTKKKREREKRQLEENMKRGLSGGSSWEASHNLSSSKKSGSKRKPDERTLKCTEGHFKGGILNVKNLLRSKPSSEGVSFPRGGEGKLPGFSGEGKKRKGGGGGGGGGKEKGKGRH